MGFKELSRLGRLVSELHPLLYYPVCREHWDATVHDVQHLYLHRLPWKGTPAHLVAWVMQIISGLALANEVHHGPVWQNR